MESPHRYEYKCVCVTVHVCGWQRRSRGLTWIPTTWTKPEAGGLSGHMVCGALSETCQHYIFFDFFLLFLSLRFLLHPQRIYLTPLNELILHQRLQGLVPTPTTAASSPAHLRLGTFHSGMTHCVARSMLLGNSSKTKGPGRTKHTCTP